MQAECAQSHTTWPKPPTMSQLLNNLYLVVRGYHLYIHQNALEQESTWAYGKDNRNETGLRTYGTSLTEEVCKTLTCTPQRRNTQFCSSDSSSNLISDHSEFWQGMNLQRTSDCPKDFCSVPTNNLAHLICSLSTCLLLHPVQMLNLAFLILYPTVHL